MDGLSVGGATIPQPLEGILAAVRNPKGCTVTRKEAKTSMRLRKNGVLPPMRQAWKAAHGDGPLSGAQAALLGRENINDTEGVAALLDGPPITQLACGAAHRLPRAREEHEAPLLEGAHHLQPGEFKRQPLVRHRPAAVDAVPVLLVPRACLVALLRVRLDMGAIQRESVPVDA